MKKLLLIFACVFVIVTNVEAQQTNPNVGTTCLTGTAAAGTGVTLTIPSGGAGTFQYLTYLEVREYASVATVGAAAPILVTTTNISGTPTLTFDTAVPVGTSNTQTNSLVGFSTLKAAAAATAVTIVAPAITSIIWRLNGCWFVGQ